MSSAPQPLIRVLVVDDSDLQRSMLVSILGRDPGLVVVGQASSGQQAIALTHLLHPDIILIDWQMPGLDGLATTRQLMHEVPTPVILTGASVSATDRQLLSTAFAAGALAIVPKPAAGQLGTVAAADLIEAVKRMAVVRVLQRRSPGEPAPRASVSPLRPIAAASTVAVPPLGGGQPRVVAIGSSTGGPQALQAILTRLPATFQMPVLVVQHIVGSFLPQFVTWLGAQCALPMQVATPGLRLGKPGIYLAPSDQHMIIQGQEVAFSAAPPIRGHRPSATILFRSIAQAYGPFAVGIVLTGMGDDGALGLAEMRARGAVTIAQDEASSAVFGMPAAAIALGAAGYILAPPAIGQLLLQLDRLGAPELRNGS